MLFRFLPSHRVVVRRWGTRKVKLKQIFVINNSLKEIFIHSGAFPGGHQFWLRNGGERIHRLRWLWRARCMMCAAAACAVYVLLSRLKCTRCRVRVFVRRLNKFYFKSISKLHLIMRFFDGEKELDDCCCANDTTTFGDCSVLALKSCDKRAAPASVALLN